MWLTHVGVPEFVVVDQGAEFESATDQECEEFGIDIRITHAGWQQGLVERHSGFLGEIGNNVVRIAHGRKTACQYAELAEPAELAELQTSCKQQKTPPFQFFVTRAQNKTTDTIFDFHRVPQLWHTLGKKRCCEG